MLILLLQQFAEITLDEDALPSAGKPPAYWANEPGRQGIERLNWKSHLTLYANVRVYAPFYLHTFPDFFFRLNRNIGFRL